MPNIKITFGNLNEHSEDIVKTFLGTSLEVNAGFLAVLDGVRVVVVSGCDYNG